MRSEGGSGAIGGSATGDNATGGDGTGGSATGGSGTGGSATGGSATGGSGATTPGAPTAICDEPEPWPIPGTTRVVGDGTPPSCTEQALREAVSEGGFVRFECGEDPVTLAIASAIEVHEETIIDGEAKVTLDGGGTSQIFVVSGKLSVRNLRFVNGKAK